MLILVMGMGRSGTSLIMQLLRAAGVDCGGGWIAPNENNPRGYFERGDVMDFNIRLLREASGGSGALFPLPDGEAVRRLVGTPVPCRFPGHDFAVKDPRFSIVYPVWHETLSPLGVRAVHARRDAEAIAESLARAYGIPLAEGRRITAEYTRRAEAHIRDYNLPAVEIWYEQWFENPDANRRALEELTGLALPRDLSPWLDPSLRHCSGRRSGRVHTFESLPPGGLPAREIATDAFRENLLALRTAHPGLADLIGRHHEQCDTNIERRGGDFVCRAPDGVEWTIPADESRHPVAHRLAGHDPRREGLLIAGIGALLPGAILSRPPSELSPAVLIEPSLDRAVCHLLARRCAEIVKLPQFYPRVGPDAFEAALEDFAGALKPYLCAIESFFPLIAPPAAPGEQRAFGAFLTEFRNRFAAGRAKAVAAAKAFQAKFEKGAAGPIRKVFIAAPSAECWLELSRGWAHGMGELGVEVAVHPVPFPPSKIAARDTLEILTAVREFAPDLLVTLSHPSDLIVRGIERAPVPRAVWYADEPDHLIQYPHGPHDRVFYSWREFEDRLRDRGGLFRGEILTGSRPLPARETPGLRCEVAFVGAIEDTGALLGGLPGGVREAVDAVTDAKLRELKTPFPELWERHGLGPDERRLLAQCAEAAHRKHGMDDIRLLTLVLHMECIRKRRLSLILSLEGFGTAVYGNAAWGDLLRGTPMEGAYKGRGLTYGECCDLYRTADISLNIHSPYLHSGPNQRDIDIPMCGGFLLSDLHRHAGARMGEFFEPDQEIALYDGPEDLPRRVRHCLDNPAGRRAITEAARARIGRDHTFARRARQLLNRIFD